MAATAEVLQPVTEPMTASIHVADTKLPRLVTAKNFLRRNQTVLTVIAVAAGAIWINRILIRRDLKHINFTAEFYPDWMFDESGEFVGIGSD